MWARPSLLTQERDLEIELLHKQLEEFKVGAAAISSGQLALATTAALSAGGGPGIAVADRPPASSGGGGAWGAAVPAQRPSNSLR